MEERKLFVKNLEDKVTRRQVEELFSIYGDVNSVKIQKEKRCGCIEMSTRSEAKRAQAALNGEMFWGRALIVDAFREGAC